MIGYKLPLNMTELHFDPNGNLTPYEKITTDLATFEKVFVTDFENSTTRKTLFDNYLWYLEAFSKEITPNFTQWINGSFVTLKENPKDIDFVTFIDRKLYAKKENYIEKYWTIDTYDIGLDAYFVKSYEPNEDLFSQYKEYQQEWNERYRRTRKDDFGNHQLKGFIEINFNF